MEGLSAVKEKAMRAVDDGGSRAVAAAAHPARASMAKPAGGSRHAADGALLHKATTGTHVDRANALRALDMQTGDRRKTDDQVEKAGHPSSPPATSGMGSFLDDTVHIIETAARAGGEAVGDAGKAVQAGIDQTAHSLEALGKVGVHAARDVASAVSKEGVPRTIENVGHAALVQAGRIAQGAAAHPFDPAGFANWLAGPRSPSGEDMTAAVPGLQKAIGTAIDRAMKDSGVSNAIGWAFGFKHVAEGDYYTTTKNSLQSLVGFQDSYDAAGKLLGMDIDHKIMNFKADGIAYRVEIWKGGYANGGAFGGEIGVYTRGGHDRGIAGDIMEKLNPGYYSSADGKHQVQMSQTIYNTHTKRDYFTNPGSGSENGKHYWNLAIRTSPGITREDLGQRGTLTMNTEASAKGLYKALKDQGLDPQIAGKTVTYDWK